MYINFHSYITFKNLSTIFTIYIKFTNRITNSLSNNRLILNLVLWLEITLEVYKTQTQSFKMNIKINRIQESRNEK